MLSPDMTAAGTPCTHIATFMQSLGGLQAVVRHHLATDHQGRLHSRFVSLFEATSLDPRVTALGLTGFDSIRGARRRLQQALPPRPDDAVIYHDLWGLPFFAELDQAHRRLGLIHCPAPEVLEILTRHHTHLDGLLCVSEPSLETVRRRVPDFPAERLGRLPLPVCPPDSSKPQAPIANRPFVLGYGGRLIQEHKRVDKLPQLWQALASRESDVRLEILGDGPARKQLERAFRDTTGITFLGCQEGLRYWHTISQWDAIVYVSDLEGLGLSLLEAMSVGVLPLYPRIGGAEDYVANVRGDLLYEPDDFVQLAGIIRDLRNATESEIQSLRLKCRQSVAGHLGSAYQESFAAFLERIRELPRRSPAALPARRIFPSDFLPLGLLRRFHKRGLRLGNRGQ